MSRFEGFSTEPDFCAEEARKLSEKAIVGLPDIQKIEAAIIDMAENGGHSSHITVKGMALADKICWYFNNRNFSITKLTTNNSGEESEVDIIISW